MGRSKEKRRKIDLGVAKPSNTSYNLNMETTNNTNPAALNALTDAQVAWCAANGIETFEDRGIGFGKGERWIEPVRANDGAYLNSLGRGWGSIELFEVDHSEDGDGARVVAHFDTLRAALKALAGD